MTAPTQQHIDGYMQGLQRALKLCEGSTRNHEQLIRMEIKHSQMFAERRGYQVARPAQTEQRGPDAGIVLLCAVFGLIGIEILRWCVT